MMKSYWLVWSYMLQDLTNGRPHRLKQVRRREDNRDVDAVRLSLVRRVSKRENHPKTSTSLRKNFLQSLFRSSARSRRPERKNKRGKDNLYTESNSHIGFLCRWHVRRSTLLQHWRTDIYTKETRTAIDLPRSKLSLSIVVFYLSLSLD